MTSPAENAGSGHDYDLVVAGGGAAGFFGAIACAESCSGARILIVEKSREVLGKVKISGGGRCNVTHACFDPRELVESYPRGSRQLIGPLHRWGPADTMAWFEDRGVALKTEDDGRIFPQSDESQTIIACLERAASESGVEVRTELAVAGVEALAEGGFIVSLESGEKLNAGQVLLTTGGIRNPAGAEIAARFGHAIEPAAPSLFTFKIDDPRIEELQGLSVTNATVKVAGHDLEASGPLLVTHWGLSGPGILRLSAWGARELQAVNYRFEIQVNWTGGLGEEQVMARFDQLRDEARRRKVVNGPQFDLPARLWKRLVEAAAAENEDRNKRGDSVGKSEMRWPHLPRALARSLSRQLCAGRFAVDGKSMNKEEFVTCGGVCLDEVNFKTMESRLQHGLHFAGEVLDIDGLTGGFNFQAAWTTGRIAGESIAAAIGDKARG